MIRRAVEAARASDVAVVVVGGGPRTCGENKSRTSLDLPGRQELLLREVHKVGKPMIVVLINGRPLSINWGGGSCRRDSRSVVSRVARWYCDRRGAARGV